MRVLESSSRIETTSSVMEYQNFEEAVITGDQMVSREKPLDYDKMVIESLYYGKTFDLEISLHFVPIVELMCTLT